METILHFLGPRLTGAPLTVVNGPGMVEHKAFQNGRPSAGILGDQVGRAYKGARVLPFDVVDDVAIIPIEGSLVHKGAYVGAESGQTSYQGIRAQIERAREPDIKAAVLEVDSCGGQCAGAFETAEAMRRLSHDKPTLAILTDFAYSAAYLLASQARTIIAPDFGGAGSIGVIMVHADFSGNLAKEGIAVSIIHSGRHKAEGNAYEPLPDDVRGRWQAEVDAMRDRFAELVGKDRGARFDKAAALKTEAQAYTAPEALRLGLVDAIGDPHRAFKAFVQEVNRKEKS
jgi:signal peptide peptidase SppA